MWLAGQALHANLMRKLICVFWWKKFYSNTFITQDMLFMQLHLKNFNLKFNSFFENLLLIDLENDWWWSWFWLNWIWFPVAYRLDIKLVLIVVNLMPCKVVAWVNSWNSSCQAASCNFFCLLRCICNNTIRGTLWDFLWPHSCKALHTYVAICTVPKMSPGVLDY